MGLFSQPRIGFHFGEDSLSFAVLEPHRGRLKIKAFDRFPLPEKSIRFSPLEPNLLNLPFYRKEIERILNNWKKVKVIGLSLPDPSIRTVLMEIKGSFPKKKEFDQMVKWQIEKNFLTQLGEAEYSHQLLAQDHSSIMGSKTEGKERHFYFLETALLKVILAQYRSLFTGFNVILRFINIESFYLFNFYHDEMVKTASGGNFLFVHFFGRYLTLLSIENGLLRGIRLKAVLNGGDGTEEETGSLKDPRQTKRSHALENFLEETLQENNQNRLSHLFISGSSFDPSFYSLVAKRFQIDVCPLNPSRFIEVEPIKTVHPDDLDAMVSSAAAVAGK